MHGGGTGGRAWNSTLPARKAPMKRTGFRKPDKGEAGKAKLKPSLSPVAGKRKAQLREYRREKSEWFKRPENRFCAVCVCRAAGIPWREAKAGILENGRGFLVTCGLPICPSTEVHHYRGRIGRLLADSRFFIGTCRECREWPHLNPEEARRLGLLSPAAEWNVFPGPDERGF